MDDVWTAVHAERAALIEDLARLDERRWDEPSPCAGWTVHDVLAHLVDTALTTRIRFVAGLARARFDFDRQNADGVRRHRGPSPADTLEHFRRVAHRTSTPPAPRDTRLVEAIVHGEDIRRPLGIRGAYPADAVVRAVRLQARTSAAFGGAKELLRSVRLVATDADLVVGTGAEARGPALEVLLAVSGRVAATDDLSGPGVELLRAARAA